MLFFTICLSLLKFFRCSSILIKFDRFSKTPAVAGSLSYIQLLLLYEIFANCDLQPEKLTLPPEFYNKLPILLAYHTFTEKSRSLRIIKEKMFGFFLRVERNHMGAYGLSLRFLWIGDMVQIWKHRCSVFHLGWHACSSY